MINETLATNMGFGTPEETIGRNISINNQPPRQIVGVVKNFHYASLHAEIGPFVIERYPGPGLFRGFGRYAAVRISSENVDDTIAFLTEKWKQFVPDRAMEYQFLDQELDDLYKAEATLGKVATGFSILGILIACLGLFGMAMFSAERRTKEIGIRKALGASTSSIVTLLSQESAKMVLLAFILACPVAWYALNEWLSTFSFRTTISVVPFVVAGVLVLVVAWATVSLQSIRAASANPVDSLQQD